MIIAVTLAFLLATFYFARTIHHAEGNRQRLSQLVWWAIIVASYMFCVLGSTCLF